MSVKFKAIKLKKVRSCPICPACGSKKFERLKTYGIVVRCIKCRKTLML